MPDLSFDNGRWKALIWLKDPDEQLPWPRGGIMLKNVTHDGYNLARDIRVARIWVFGTKGEAESFIIGEDDFEVEKFSLHSDSLDINNPSKGLGSNPNPDYPHYNSGVRGYAHARYKLKHGTESKLFGPDDPGLVVEQKFLFTDYGKNPAHEPGAVLDATRIFPMVSFSTLNKKVASIRVDYRMEFSLDMFLDPEVTMSDLFGPSYSSVGANYSLMLPGSGVTKAQLVEAIRKRPCMAGVFRDQEDLPMSASNLKSLFAALEKPCPYEIFTYGLRGGLPGEATKHTAFYFKEETPMSPKDQIVESNTLTSRNTWDNIHIWGAGTINGKPLRKSPTTPGALHALHMHWRWGRIAGDPGFFEMIGQGFGKAGNGFNPFDGGALGDPQFQGLHIGDSDYGGPLLDPQLPYQTIRFAITRTKPPAGSSKSFAANDFPSEKVFEDLFYSAATANSPQKMDDGGDLILWMSIEAHTTGERLYTRARNADGTPTEPVFKPLFPEVATAGSTAPKPFEGTLFVHGFYFGHNPESSDINVFDETLGKDLQYPASKKTWYRTP